MSLKNKVLTLGLATAMIVGGSAAAFAATAYATSNVNVRSGPGTGYDAVDVLRRGEAVDVDYCRGSWCRVIKSGPDGWVAASYLTRDGDRYDDRFDNRVYEAPRYVRPSYGHSYRSYRPYTHYQQPPSACIGGGGASFCITQ